MKGFRLRNIWPRKASKDEFHPICPRNNVVKFSTTSPPKPKSVSDQIRTTKVYPVAVCNNEDNEEANTTTKTVYSDSIIVHAAVPQRKKNDSGDRYVKENADSKKENLQKVTHVDSRTQEQSLTRNQVVNMLKSRFKEDLEDWKQRDRRPLDVRSEPSRSPTLSRKRYGVLIQNPDAYPTLPRKTDGKSGAIWLQCGDEVKQVLLPREGLSLGKIRQMFQNNFKGELEKLEFGADRCIVLIKDPFSRAFKELEDVRYVLPGSHLKLLGPKKKPTRDKRHQVGGKNVSFDERRRSRSFTYENNQSDSTLGSPTGFSRARVGSYSFHGHPYSSSQGTIRRGILTSTPKPNHAGSVLPSGVMAGQLSKVEQNSLQSQKRQQLQNIGAHSFDLTPPRTLDRYDLSNSRFNESDSPTRMVKIPCIDGGIRREIKRTPRNPVEEQLASLTNLLQEALRTDSISDVNNNGCESSSDSLNAPTRPNYLPLNQDKKRSPSDSGTESLISEKNGPTRDECRAKPPPPYRSSSRNAMKFHSPQKECNTNESNQESPRKSIARPRVWIDTSNRARDNHIKVTSAYLKKDVKQLRIQLEELRNQHEYNAHVFNTLLSKTGQQIMAAVEAALQDGNENNPSLQRRKLLAEEKAYQRRSDNAEKTMRRLENEIEMLRESAVTYKSNVKADELNEIHGSIEDVSRSIASLKSDFKVLNTETRAIMGEELQSLLEEERFLKEEPIHLDQLVNRCRHAAGTLFTLQKLASVQNEGKGSLSPVTFLQKSKVEYAGLKETADYNQNTISPGNGMKAKVRFNDSADHITYHQ